MHQLAAAVEVVALSLMWLVIVRMLWRGYHGEPLRPSRASLIGVLACALVAIAVAVVSLLT